MLSLGVVSDASAGSIADFTPCPKSGTDLVCPVGTTGQAYSIKFRGDEDPICAPGDDKWYARNGSVPPGLNTGNGRHALGHAYPGGHVRLLATSRASRLLHRRSGSRTAGHESRLQQQRQLRRARLDHDRAWAREADDRAGVHDARNDGEAVFAADDGDRRRCRRRGRSTRARFRRVSHSTPSTGLISGTPTAAGQFDFQVLAKMNADTRTDTKALGIVVRDATRHPRSRPVHGRPSRNR